MLDLFLAYLQETKCIGLKRQGDDECVFIYVPMLVNKPMNPMNIFK